MTARRRFGFLVVLAACGSPAAPPAPPSNAAARAPVPPAADIVLQLAYRETFSIGPPFSSVPPFTLLADGTLITAAAGHPPPILASRLDPAEVQRILDRVRELGIERLESYTDSCKAKDNNLSICTSDGSYTILRFAFAGGAPREVVTYDIFSNEPETMSRVVDYLAQFPHPRGERYVPTRAAIHVARRDRTDPRPADCPAIELADLPRPPDALHDDWWGVVVEDPALARVLALGAGRPNRYHFDACTSTDVYRLVVMPGVPGSDLAHELRTYAVEPEE